MNDFEKADYDKASHIISSKYRTITYQLLLDSVMTPSAVSKNSRIDMSHASRALRELEEQNIVELKVSEDTTRGRIYGLTQEGKDLESMVNMLK